MPLESIIAQNQAESPRSPGRANDAHEAAGFQNDRLPPVGILNELSLQLDSRRSAATDARKTTDSAITASKDRNATEATFLDFGQPILKNGLYELNLSKAETKASRANEVSLSNSVTNPSDAAPVSQAQFETAFRHSRVIGVPDDHVSIDNKIGFARSMDNLRAAGGTAVGFELLAQGMQPTLDRYAQALREQATSGADPQRDLFIRDTRNQLEQAFMHVFENGAPNNNARAMADCVDAAIRAGLRPIALEPNLDNAYQENGGYNALRSAIRKLPETQATDADIMRYLNPESSPADRAAARANLTNSLAATGWQGSVESAFQTLDRMRDSNPPVDFQNFSAALHSAHGDENSPMLRNVIQDFRNQNFKQIIDGLGADQKIVVFAGLGHVIPQPGLSSLWQPGLFPNGIGIDRPAIQPWCGSATGDQPICAKPPVAPN
jgi:hypothetical protein